MILTATSHYCACSIVVLPFRHGVERICNSLARHMAHDNRRTPDELADEEKLDDLDPLRHLREVDNEVQVDSDSAHTSAAIVVPKQLHNHRGSQIMKFEDISVTLEIDASPGCGGLAWPAGEVIGMLCKISRPTHRSADEEVHIGAECISRAPWCKLSFQKEGPGTW